LETVQDRIGLGKV